jgi:hypothetical protein
MYRVIKINGYWTAIEMQSPRTALLMRSVSKPTTRYLNDSIDILSDLPTTAGFVCLVNSIEEFENNMGIMPGTTRVLDFSDQKVNVSTSPDNEAS